MLAAERYDKDPEAVTKEEREETKTSGMVFLYGDTPLNNEIITHLNMCMRCIDEIGARKHLNQEIQTNEAQETLARWGAQAAANPIE